jgi:hypothetical protein
VKRVGVPLELTASAPMANEVAATPSRCITSLWRVPNGGECPGFAETSGVRGCGVSARRVSHHHGVAATRIIMRSAGC